METKKGYPYKRDNILVVDKRVMYIGNVKYINEKSTPVKPLPKRTK